MKQGEHAVEIFEEIFKQGQRFFFGWQRLEYSADKDVAEYFWFPVLPLGFFFVDSILDGLLERCVARLLVDPLDAFTRKDGESRGRPWWRLAGTHVRNTEVHTNISRLAHIVGHK